MNKLSKYSDKILNWAIGLIVFATFAIGAVVLYNVGITSANSDATRESQTYTRFNSCAIAQRSYKGAATLSRQDLDYCWDRAEADTGYQVTRYYGQSIN